MLSVTTDQTNAGNQFCIGFFQNRFGDRGEQESIPPVIWVTTEESTPVNFNVTTIAGLLFSGVATRGQTTFVNTTLGLIVFETDPEDPAERFKGICIQAEGNRTVVVFGQHEELASNDAYQALPVFEMPLGRPYEYIVASILGAEVTEESDSVALIVGTEDDTDVTVIPPASLPTGIPYPQAPLGAFFPVLPDNSLNTINIGRFEVAYLQVRNIPPGDLTGTRIIANKPITVISGHECGSVPGPRNPGPCDHLIEQIPPIDMWGTEVAVVPLRTRAEDRIKVIASQDSTIVNVTFTNPSSGEVTIMPSFTLSAEGFREIDTGAYTLIQSNRPIAVFQFSKSWQTDGTRVSDPFMFYVPPCEQYRDSYGVATAPFDPSLEGTADNPLRGPYTNYTNIAIPAAYYDVDQLTINGGTPNGDDFIAIRNADNSIWGYGAQLLLDAGAQVISHDDDEAGFGLTMYGFSNQMSWGLTAGQRLAPVALCK